MNKCGQLASCFHFKPTGEEFTSFAENSEMRNSFQMQLFLDNLISG